MARPLSIEEKTRRGTYDKNPQNRPAQDATTPKGHPVIPPDLDGYARAKWDELSIHLDAMQVLSPVDGSTLEALCRAYALWKHYDERFKDGGSGDRHIMLNWHRAMDAYRKLLVEFGLSPSARGKVQALAPGAADDPFARILQINSDCG